MASSTVPKKPSNTEFIEEDPPTLNDSTTYSLCHRMMGGPRVDVYVGAGKKHYSLPKKLLCHYSKYFSRCFNGNFVEGETQKLELPEDKVQDSDLLLEYMLHHGLTSEFKATSQVFDEGVKECMAFVKYVSKYDLGEVSIAIHEPLAEITKMKADASCDGNTRRPSFVIAEDAISTIFTLTPMDSPLRAFMVHAVLSGTGITGLSKYQKHIDHVPGFGVSLLTEVRQSVVMWTWMNPITDVKHAEGTLGAYTRW